MPNEPNQKTYEQLVEENNYLNALVEQQQKELARMLENKSMIERAVEGSGFDPWENNFVTGERLGAFDTFKSLGYDENERPKSIEGILSLIHPEDLTVIQHLLDEHFKGMTNFYQSEFRIKAKDGSWIWFGNYGKVLERDENENILKFSGLTFNINRRRIVEDEVREAITNLESANIVKNAIISILGHDLLNPINLIIGYSEQINEAGILKNYEKIVEFSEYINQISNQARNLLLNMLEWANVQTGRVNYKIREVNLSDITDEVITLNQNSIQKKKINIVNNIPNNFKLNTDSQLIQSILRNTISNAIKYSLVNGQVTINIQKTEDFYILRIIDEGIGMSEEELEHIFSLRKVRRVGTMGEKGSGIGLSVCYELLNRFGGTIEVTSTPDNGSCFNINIPTKNNL